MAAAREPPDFIIRPIGNERRRLRIPTEEVLADVSAITRFEDLIFAVDALFHQFPELAALVAQQKFVPLRAPDDFDDVPPGAAEIALQFLDDFAVAANGTVEPLQIAIDDEDQVVELLPARERNRAEAFRLVHLAVAAENPDFSPVRFRETTIVKILQEARLIDRHQRTEAHRDGRKLPEVRHQPRMRIGRQSAPADLATKMDQLIFGQSPFEKRAGVNSRRRMPLKHDQVAAVFVRRCTPEMHEAGFIERRCGLIARDMAAKLS